MGKHDDAILTVKDVGIGYSTNITDILSGSPYTIVAHSLFKPDYLYLVMRGSAAGSSGFIPRLYIRDSEVAEGLQVYGYNGNTTWQVWHRCDISKEYIICLRLNQGVATCSLFSDTDRVKVFESSCSIAKLASVPFTVSNAHLLKVWDKDVYDKCKQEIANGKY